MCNLLLQVPHRCENRHVVPVETFYPCSDFSIIWLSGTGLPTSIKVCTYKAVTKCHMATVACRTLACQITLTLVDFDTPACYYFYIWFAFPWGRFLLVCILFLLVYPCGHFVGVRSFRLLPQSCHLGSPSPSPHVRGIEPSSTRHSSHSCPPGLRWDSVPQNRWDTGRHLSVSFVWLPKKVLHISFSSSILSSQTCTVNMTK
jgi:hypothetical protein